MDYINPNEVYFVCIPLCIFRFHIFLNLLWCQRVSEWTDQAKAGAFRVVCLRTCRDPKLLFVGCLSPQLPLISFLPNLPCAIVPSLCTLDTVKNNITGTTRLAGQLLIG